MNLPCTRCEKVRPSEHGSGLCRSCYVWEHTRLARCSVCKEIRKHRSGGLCARCYLAQPHVREIKNAARRKKYAEDPAHRAALQATKTTPAYGEYKKQYDRKLNYNLDEAQYQLMLAAQEHACVICRLGFSTERKETTVHVDHNHQTGVVRGLLCGACNRGLGCFKADPSLLRKAQSYLHGGN